MGDPKKKDPSDGSDKTFSQDDLERELKKRLDRERAKYSDYDELKAFKEAADAKSKDDKGQADELTEQLGKLQKDLDEERLTRLRLEVAADKGLTPAQAKRLTGTNREELETDADDLLEAFPAKADSTGGGDDSGRRSRPPSRQPKTELKGGNDPDSSDGGDDEIDPAKLAESIPRP